MSSSKQSLGMGTARYFSLESWFRFLFIYNSLWNYTVYSKMAARMKNSSEIANVSAQNVTLVLVCKHFCDGVMNSPRYVPEYCFLMVGQSTNG
jgi:hypothetical protein